MNTVFCSWDCYREFDSKRKHKQEGICEFCGNNFFKKYKSQRFCCVTCQNQWQSQEGHAYIPRKDSLIETIIKKIIKRYEY